MFLMLIDFQEQPTPEPGSVKYNRSAYAFAAVPVRLRIGDVDLLGYVEETINEPSEFRWVSLSILDIAKWGLFSVKRARELGRYVYELGSHGDTGAALLFEMSGDEILVHSTMTERTARISYRSLVEAWEAFAERVRKYILHEFPQMKNEPGWGEWLAGKDILMWGAERGELELFPNWKQWFEENEHAFENVDGGYRVRHSSKENVKS